MKEKISRQEEFARENFNGLNELGQEVVEAINGFYDFDKQREIIEKRFIRDKGLGNFTETDISEELKSNYDEAVRALEYLFPVIVIKMSSSIAHAVNGRSTKTLKDLLRFMDKFSISADKCVRDLRTLATTRRTSDTSFIHLAALIAAQVDDIDFLKEIEKFSEKNKYRKNIYRIFNISTYGEMGSSIMCDFGDKRRIALEALVNGSKDVYKHITDGKGIDADYISKFIVADGYFDKLTPKEVEEVVILEPTLLDILMQHMPDNVPKGLDFFYF